MPLQPVELVKAVRSVNPELEASIIDPAYKGRVERRFLPLRHYRLRLRCNRKPTFFTTSSLAINRSKAPLNHPRTSATMNSPIGPRRDSNNMGPPSSPRRAPPPPANHSPKQSISTPTTPLSTPPITTPRLPTSNSSNGSPRRDSANRRPIHPHQLRHQFYEGSPMPTSTPSSSIASDLDGISETDIPSPLINTHHQHQIKPKQAPRNLVICLDGTHNSFCDHNSNVVRLFELLEKSDRQLCYYDSGVGTQQGPWLYGLKKDFAMVTDLAFAW